MPVDYIVNKITEGHARGERERAKRTQNQNRVKAGKKQVRLAWENLKKNNEQDIESLAILQRNTNKYLDRLDEIAARDWAIGEEDRLADFENRVEAYNQSIEDYHETLGLIDISNNIAIEEENNYMNDFYTNLAYEALEAQYALDDRMTELGFEAEKARLDIDVAMKQGASQRELLKLQNKAKRAQSAFESQSDIVKGMQQKGKIRATGAAGRSSRKAVQAVEAGVGMRQAMRVDALLNSNSVFRNQIQASYDNLYYKKLGYKSTLDTIDAATKIAQRDYNLNRQQAADTLKSGIRANETRMAKIAAGKYSAEIQAKRQVLDVPTPGRQEPLPYKAIRPEFPTIDKLTQKDKRDFFDQHMPHLEDENKIVGYEGREPWWQTGLEIAGEIGKSVVAGYAPGLAAGGEKAGQFSWSSAVSKGFQ